MPSDPSLLSPLKTYTPEQLSALPPAALAEYELLFETIRREQERERCEGSLLTFFARAWREIDSATLSVNWHHETICEALENICYGRNRNLIINIPPRHTKSLLANIIWPAWIWAQSPSLGLPLMGPHVKFLCVSYGATLAERMALTMKRLIEGEWYQMHWGHQVQLRPDQASRADFANFAGGERVSNSIEGGILGRGADIRIIDDPQTRRGADSLAERMASLQGMSDLTTRITDPRIVAQVLIQQRLHVNDATDWALKNWPEERVHLMYPARFEPDRAAWGDPRTRPGELLWPDLWSDAELRNIEMGLKALDGDRLSDYAVAGQLQQNPVPRGGGIIKREWLMPWPTANFDGSFPQDMVKNGRIQYPAFEYVVACVDTAFTTKQQNDRSAMVVLGLFRAEGKGRVERRGDQFVRVADDYGFPKVLVMYGWAKRLELHGPPEDIPSGMTKEQWNSPRMRLQRQENWGLVEWVVDTCQRYKVDHLRILTLGQGHGLEQEMRRLHSDGDWGLELETERGDKEARAYAVQHLFSSRQIFIPMYEDGALPKWCDPLVDEITLFPRGQRDDYMDAMCGALRHLRDTNLMERREEFDRAETRAAQWTSQKRQGLPYPV